MKSLKITESRTFFTRNYVKSFTQETYWDGVGCWDARKPMKTNIVWEMRLGGSVPPPAHTH